MAVRGGGRAIFQFCCCLGRVERASVVKPVCSVLEIPLTAVNRMILGATRLHGGQIILQDQHYSAAHCDRSWIFVRHRNMNKVRMLLMSIPISDNEDPPHSKKLSSNDDPTRSKKSIRALKKSRQPLHCERIDRENTNIRAGTHVILNPQFANLSRFPDFHCCCNAAREINEASAVLAARPWNIRESLHTESRSIMQAG